MKHKKISGYTPAIPIKTYITDLVDAVFRLPYRWPVQCEKSTVTDAACDLILDPVSVGGHPFTNRVVAAGAVYCAFIQCNIRLSQKQLSDIADMSDGTQYVNIISIGLAARYIRDLNKLEMIW